MRVRQRSIINSSLVMEYYLIRPGYVSDDWDKGDLHVELCADGDRTAPGYLPAMDANESAVGEFEFKAAY